MLSDAFNKCKIIIKCLSALVTFILLVNADLTTATATFKNNTIEKEIKKHRLSEHDLFEFRANSPVNGMRKFEFSYVTGSGNNPLKVYNSKINHLPSFKLYGDIKTHIVGRYNSAINYGIKNFKLTKANVNLGISKYLKMSIGLDKHFLTNLETYSIVGCWSPTKQLELYLTCGSNRKIPPFRQIDETHIKYPIEYNDVKNEDPKLGGFDTIPSGHISLGFNISSLRNKINITAGVLVPDIAYHSNNYTQPSLFSNEGKFFLIRFKYDAKKHNAFEYVKTQISYSGGVGEYSQFNIPMALIFSGESIYVPTGVRKFYTKGSPFFGDYIFLEKLNILLKTKHTFGHLQLHNHIMYDKIIKISDDYRKGKDKRIKYRKKNVSIYDQILYYTSKIKYHIPNHENLIIIADSGIGFIWNYNNKKNTLWHILIGINYSPDLDKTKEYINTSNNNILKFIKNNFKNGLKIDTEIAFGRNQWEYYRRAISVPTTITQYGKLKCFKRFVLNESFKVTNTDNIDSELKSLLNIDLVINQLNIHYLYKIFDTFMGYDKNVVTGDKVWERGTIIRPSKYLEVGIDLEYPKYSNLITKHLSIINSSIYNYKKNNGEEGKLYESLHLEFYKDPKEIKFPILSSAVKLKINSNTYLKFGSMMRYFRLRNYSIVKKDDDYVVEDNGNYTTYFGWLLHSEIKINWINIKINYQMGCGDYTIIDKTHVVCNGIGIIPPNYYRDNGGNIQITKTVDYKLSIDPQVNKDNKLLIDFIGLYCFSDFRTNTINYKQDRLRNGTKWLGYINIGDQMNIKRYFNISFLVSLGWMRTFDNIYSTKEPSKRSLLMGFKVDMQYKF